MARKPKKIIIINGSPKKNGNTSVLCGWISEGAKSLGADIEIINAALLKYRSGGCLSCRKCQSSKKFGCSIKDDATAVLKKMGEADVVVMATPLYFYGPSAQLKNIIDRMFSLYKWNNDENTFISPLKGKVFALAASAYEDIGLDALERPFRLTADYSGMKFLSLLIPNAGVSGALLRNSAAKTKAVEFGKSLACME